MNTSPLRVPDGTVEVLKWIGVASMTLDHVNKYLLGGHVAWMFAVGRLALPIFAFVLGYNLARPQARESGIHKRALTRLAIFAAVASVPVVALGGLVAGWWPLNILATLAVATVVITLLDRGGASTGFAALAVFLAGGALVEFWWAGVAACVAAWWYCRAPSPGRLMAWALALAALTLDGWAFAGMAPLNLGLVAVGALPLILLVARQAFRVPRLRYVFYGYYPLHLAALWLLTRLQ